MSDPIDTLNKLFDTLKDASNRSESSTNKLIDQQMELITYIKTMPLEDLRESLKDHALKSDKDQADCNGALELRYADVMESLRAISNKISKMIIVVSVVIAVATTGYFIIRYAAEKGAPPAKWEQRLQEIEQDQHEDIDDRLNEFMKQIKELMDEAHGKG